MDIVDRKNRQSNYRNNFEALRERGEKQQLRQSYEL